MQRLMGLMIIGIQGAGKSRISKAIASFWSLPLLRLDIGRVFSGIVGSSEENLRSVIKTAESVAPCIMWCDEIDKAFSGVSGATDSGTSSRIFGTFLTWMQEKKAPVFVVATANVVANLPPELIRKGRFDDIFFVDLPDNEEREQIWTIHLEQRNFKISDFDLKKLISHSEGFTGAEIEAAIISAMYEGFSDNERSITTVDIIKELKESVPIYITMKEKIEELREWASKRARNASKSKHAVVVREKLAIPVSEDEEL
jgi:SpoVK/Ycf46/Vps4 family AAA+-type ATPase